MLPLDSSRCFAHMHERHACAETHSHDGRWPAQRLLLEGPDQPWDPCAGAAEPEGWLQPQLQMQDHDSRSLPALGAHDLQLTGRRLSRQPSAPVGVKRTLGEREAAAAGGWTAAQEGPPAKRILGRAESVSELHWDGHHDQSAIVRDPPVDVSLSLREIRCLQALVQVRLICTLT